MDSFEKYMERFCAPSDITDEEKNVLYDIYRAGFVNGVADAVAHHNELMSFIGKASKQTVKPS